MMVYSDATDKAVQSELDSGKYITVTVSEYEALQRDSRRVDAIRNTLDELTMKRRLMVQEKPMPKSYMTRLITLRRNTISMIHIIVNRGWNG
jgi:hypothetical protein